MPIVFGLVGILLLVSGVRGTVVGSNPSLVSLVKDDFSGKPSYWEWMLAIFFVGLIGYVKQLAPLSRAFMVLIIVVLLLHEKGFFAKLTEGFSAPLPIDNGSATPDASPVKPSGLQPLEPLHPLTDPGSHTGIA